MSTRNTPRCLGIVVLALAGAFPLLALGCRQLTLKRQAGPTRLDTLMAVYPDLRAGRFVVIADFEDPRHMEIVRLESSSLKAACTLDPRRGSPQTGRQCLEFTTAARNDAVVIDNSAAENWHLKRDWRDYDLLMMQVAAPRGDLVADITISSGAVDKADWVCSSVRLAKGWNAIRLDLADVGAHVALDDVRQIRFAVRGAVKPVTLQLDDLILTAGRDDLFGDSTNRAGELYVQKAGRRWNVGAGGRFELTFANGQIVRAFNLANDPYRVRNVVSGTVLGPSPVVHGHDGRETTDLTSFGDRVVARTRILEMSAVRAVLESQWWFAPHDDTPAPQQPPFISWKYTVYPTGQVFVEVGSGEDPRMPADGVVGFAVTLAGIVEGEVYAHAVAGSQGAADSGPVRYAVAANAQADAALLFVPGAQRQLTELAREYDVNARRLSFSARREISAEKQRSWHCHVFLASLSELSPDEARLRAVAYARPGALEPDLGTPVQGIEGSGAATGFDPATGCYTILPDDDRVRFRIDGRREPYFSPAFTIVSDAAPQAWVYVNHLVFDDVSRDADGNVIFQLPEIIRGRTTVEVLFGRPGA